MLQFCRINNCLSDVYKSGWCKVDEAEILCTLHGCQRLSLAVVTCHQPQPSGHDKDVNCQTLRRILIIWLVNVLNKRSTSTGKGRRGLKTEKSQGESMGLTSGCLSYLIYCVLYHEGMIVSGGYSFVVICKSHFIVFVRKGWLLLVAIHLLLFACVAFIVFFVRKGDCFWWQSICDPLWQKGDKVAGKFTR